MQKLFWTSVVVTVTLLITVCSAQRTNFVDQDSKLVDFEEKQFYKDNIPFLEVPDEEVEAVYYYRWSSLKRHLRYTLPGAGYIVTEFVHKVGYSQKYDTINAAAGHHIDEAKWLRDQTYVKDYINVWAREGAGNQQYSEWIADAAYQAYLLNGDKPFMQSQLQGLVKNYEGWGDRFEPELNMYFLSPHDDAMEHSASSEQTDDPYHGGLGYRPSFNSEMYANARAIANIARLSNDMQLAQEFDGKANALRAAIVQHLWDSDRKFFYHVYREDNPSLDLLDTREEIGFFPWRWGVPLEDNEEFDEAWEALFDPEGFNTAFGPTTCERRSRWYDGDQTSQCCWWNGNSWPYSTGITLRSLAAQVKHYRSTAFANADSFNMLLHQYARTQYKDGKPYVAECHSPTGDFWVCDGRNHSEHYAHSTYNDNVLSDLIGVEPQADDTFQVNPLVPSTWEYFIAENIPYHGHDVTVLYDKNGSKYNTGTKGLHIFVNGELAGRQDDLGIMKVPVPPPVLPSRQLLQNYAANVNGFGYPMADASFSAATDSAVWQAVDGRVFYDFVPSNRWSNYGGDIDQAHWFSVDFGPGRKKKVSQIKLYVYSDFPSGEVDCPASVSVEYFNPTTSEWIAAEEQVRTPDMCVPNDVWVVDFKEVSTQQIRVIFADNVGKRTWVGISELEIWAPWPQTQEEGEYEAEDGLLGGQTEMQASDSASGGSYVGPIDDTDSWAEFPGVWADQDGDYMLMVYYTNAGTNEAVLNLMLNNFHEIEVRFPSTSGGWGDFNPVNFVEVQVPLWRGNNVLIFKHRDNGNVALDKIKVN